MDKLILVTTAPRRQGNNHDRREMVKFRSLVHRVVALELGSTFFIADEGGSESFQLCMSELERALKVKDPVLRHSMGDGSYGRAVSDLGTKIRYEVAKQYDTVVILLRDPRDSGPVYRSIFGESAPLVLALLGKAMLVEVLRTGVFSLQPGDSRTI